VVETVGIVVGEIEIIAAIAILVETVMTAITGATGMIEVVVGIEASPMTRATRGFRDKLLTKVTPTVAAAVVARAESEESAVSEARVVASVSVSRESRWL
jgi:hypothetical protein